MDFEFLDRIRGLISISSNKKTSNVLEGDFTSIYKGRSMEFDELAEYARGDNVRDIDWKASSRTGKVLVRRYVAERKHNVLFVMDAGKKMLGDSAAGEAKSGLALMSFGTLAYLVDRFGADYTMLRSRDRSIDYGFFRSGVEHLERLMHECRDELTTDPAHDLTALLNYAMEHIVRRMIVVIITDMEGLRKLDLNLVERLTYRNDVMVMCISDAYLTGPGSFDLESGRYAESFLVGTGKLRQAEQALRDKIFTGARQIFKEHQVQMVEINREEDIVTQIITLFDRNRLAS